MEKLYGTDMSDAAWALVEPHLPAPLLSGRPRTTCLRSVVNAIFYLFRTGCQGGCCHARFRPRARSTTTTASGGNGACGRGYNGRCTSWRAGRGECPTVAIIDGQSVKTTERAGIRGFDGQKKVKG